jgi:hypothetical protein
MLYISMFFGGRIRILTVRIQETTLLCSVKLNGNIFVQHPLILRLFMQYLPCLQQTTYPK